MGEGGLNAGGMMRWCHLRARSAEATAAVNGSPAHPSADDRDGRRLGVKDRLAMKPSLKHPDEPQP